MHTKKCNRKWTSSSATVELQPCDALLPHHLRVRAA